MMPTPTSASLLVYANVQMASETLYPVGFTSGSINPDWLVAGNNRSSKFTTTQATKFAGEWVVVAHRANTNTGFSGTVFKYVGDDDPARGLVKDQLIMSFRSTERRRRRARQPGDERDGDSRSRLGLRAEQIDDMRLHRSEKTVRNQLTAIYRKLGAGNRAEAVALYLMRRDAPTG